jgi:CheY-like chemotaxis protein
MPPPTAPCGWPVSEAPPPRALVVDDDVTGRAFLRALLRRAGCVVDVAQDGETALRMFRPDAHDVVFMDMIMPGMDGVETTLAIKSRAGDIFTPVIFVTGAGDEESLARAIDAGADDFLTKPVTAGVLLAKLRAMQRIRTLHERTRSLYARVIEDQEHAREVFERAVSARAVRSPALRARLIPADVFSGDMLLSTHTPDGGLMVMVGDFTGHGLAAALGAMPAAETFRSMAGAGHAPARVLDELNRRLAEALPRGHFLAAAIAHVDPRLASVTVANCGLPALLLCGRAGVRARIESCALALGIDRDTDYAAACRRLAVVRGERLVLASDGVTEAGNAGGAQFGCERLEALLSRIAGADRDASAEIVAALDEFREGTPFVDDVSVVEMVFEPALFGAAVAPQCMSGQLAA